MKNETVKIIRPILKGRETDYRLKTLASAALSFCATVLFALYNGFLGVRRLSIWHGSICVFYLLLAAIRGVILLTERNNAARDEVQAAKSRRRTFIISTVMLLLLNLSLILPVSLMVVMEKTGKHGAYSCNYNGRLYNL